MLIGCRTNL